MKWNGLKIWFYVVLIVCALKWVSDTQNTYTKKAECTSVIKVINGNSWEYQYVFTDVNGENWVYSDTEGTLWTNGVTYTLTMNHNGTRGDIYDDYIVKIR